MEPAIIIIVFIVPALIASAIAIFVCKELHDAGFYSWLRNKLGLFGAVVGILVSIALPFICVGISLFGLSLLGPIMCIIFAFVFIEAYRKYRASRQYALLWLLAVSAEREVPLASALEAFARERRGSFARRSRRLAKLLDSGVSLPDGLDQAPGLLPPHAPPMIRVGCRSGALAPALRRAAAVNDLNGPVWMALTGKIAYLVLLTIFGCFILTFVLMWIVPRFQKIFADLDTPLPVLTERLISCSQFIVVYGFLFTPLLALGMLLLLYPVVRYFGWNPPGMGWITRRLDAADVLDGLALVARQQMPMLDGLDSLAKSYPRSDMRMLLRRAAGDVQDGRDWVESLYSHGLIRRADLAVLQAAERVGNLPWALREMAESNRRRFAYRLLSVVQTAFPLVIILFGAIVGFIVVALFIPLISLIQALS
ncbi:MAG: type II secretion system F family protein [Planctomycetes bacterium]|nr:type II secretion system F family protein [Planctomycetota bacterium]MBU4399596.1 type II secretion system F family protein [Planctomycetota bacterium]